MTKEKQSVEDRIATKFEDSKTVRTAVFAGAGVVALGTAVGSIWKEFYEEVKKLEPFKGFAETKSKSIEAAYAQGATTARGFVRGEVRTAHKIYTDNVSREMRNIGIPKNPILGTIERAGRLGVYNIGDIAMKTGASLAVTLGGWYLLTQNMRLKSTNETQDRNLRELSRRIDEAEKRHTEQYESIGR